jgi:hypothetical protein
MANEAVLVSEQEYPINMTVADGTGIEKGAILKLADPLTASLSNGDEDYVAGIASSEKIAGDGRTKLGVYRRGIFRVSASGSITAGQAVATSSSTTGSNHVVAATATAIGGKTLGIALEDHTGGSGTILVELNPGCNNTAYS